MSAQDIFENAIDLPIDDRERFIVEECGSDADLLRSVQDLLFHHDEDDSLGLNLGLEESLEDDLVGTQLGNYTLRSVLGEGGFGVVYLADQKEPIKRRVAIKVVKLGMDSKSVVARFNAERQALAFMDHPGVASIYDGGRTDSGRPYFVMELVEGISITKFCDIEKLSVKERIKLFQQVCAAVQHAHTKGVIHRDLKPSNILAKYENDEPVIKVIDFGISKALNPGLNSNTLITNQGNLIGTPEYMSPEQAEMSALNIDTRSDVYSLGVILYELLCGSLPFDSKSIRSGGLPEIQRVLRDVIPSRPSTTFTKTISTKTDNSKLIASNRNLEMGTLSKVLSGDLDWITLKCLEKSRDRRYLSPASLLDDLDRYLQNMPVLAGPPGIFYKSKKFLQRNTAAISVSLFFVLLLILATAISSLQAIEASRQRDIAREALDESDIQRLAAEKAKQESDLQRQIAVESKNELQKKQEEVIASRDSLLRFKDYSRKILVHTTRPLTIRKQLDNSAILSWVDSMKSALATEADNRYSEEYADSLLVVAAFYFGFGQLEKAEECIRSVQAIYYELFGLEHWRSYEVDGYLLVCLTHQNKSKFESTALGARLVSAVPTLIEMNTKESIQIASAVVSSLGQSMPSMYELLVDDTRNAVDETLGSDSFFTSYFYDSLAAHYLTKDDFPVALEFRKKALHSLRRSAGANSLEEIQMLMHLSFTYQKLGDMQNSLAAAEAGLAILNERLDVHISHELVLKHQILHAMFLDEKFGEIVSRFQKSIDAFPYYFRKYETISFLDGELMLLRNTAYEFYSKFIRSALRDSNIKLAIETQDNAIKLFSNFGLEQYEYLFGFINIYNEEGMYSQAINLCNRIMSSSSFTPAEIYPYKKRAELNLAYIYINEGDKLYDAIKMLNDLSLFIEHELPEEWLSISKSYLQKAYQELASKEHFALRLDSPIEHINNVIEHYKIAIDLGTLTSSDGSVSQPYALAVIYLARLYFELSNFTLASELLEQGMPKILASDLSAYSVLFNKDSNGPLHTLVESLIQNGSSDRAKDELERYYKIILNNNFDSSVTRQAISDIADCFDQLDANTRATEIRDKHQIEK